MSIKCTQKQVEKPQQVNHGAVQKRVHFSPRITQRATVVLWFVLLSFFAFGCDMQGNPAPSAQDDGVLAGNSLRPVEEEQIENVVTEYFVRTSTAPEYRVTIEEVEEGWARVSIAPIGVTNTEDNIVYLQDQSDTAIEAPTPDPEANSNDIAPVETTSGWTIIAGPQVTFTTEELDAASVPPFIRE